MTVEFPYGSKAKGRTPEQLAVKDYCYLKYLFDQCIRRVDLRERVEKVIYALNHFTPKTKDGQIIQCKFESCNRAASNLSITIVDVRDGTSVYPGNVYCDDNAHHSVILRDQLHFDNKSHRLDVYPIKFDILSEFPHYPKRIRKDIAKFLWGLTGINGNKTQSKLERFVDEIIKNLKDRQLGFFEEQK